MTIFFLKKMKNVFFEVLEQGKINITQVILQEFVGTPPPGENTSTRVPESRQIHLIYA